MFVHGSLGHGDVDLVIHSNYQVLLACGRRQTEPAIGAGVRREVPLVESQAVIIGIPVIAIGFRLLTPSGPEKGNSTKMRNVLLGHVLRNQTARCQLLLPNWPPILVARQGYQRRQRGRVAAKLQKAVIRIGIGMADAHPERRFVLRRDPVGRIERNSDVELGLHRALGEEAHRLQFRGVGRGVQRGRKSDEERGRVAGFRLREAISTRGRRRRNASNSSHRIAHPPLKLGARVGTRTPLERQHDVAHHGLPLQIGQALGRLVVRAKVQKRKARLLLLLLILVVSAVPVRLRFREAHAGAPEGAEGVHQRIHRQRHAGIPVETV
mmetsp:Transcript_1715/g.3830  ORF Transcript_1715/g.3830 Transcript_1715/m.3830 type:complete len:324 (-) Transcript_1715:934-1905(-)